MNYKYLYFFTLTYNDDSIPVTDDGLSTACKRDVQLWIKKFRMAFERSKGVRLSDYLKYFICAEYGPNGTHRPHYHGLFMTDLDDVAIAGLFSDWESCKGFVKWDSIAFAPDERQAVANYVSKYCCKGEFASRADDIEAGLIEKAWSIMSKGIGESYVSRSRSYHIPHGKFRAMCDLDEMDTIIDRSKVSFSTPSGVMTYRMPRYYRERLYMQKHEFLQEKYDAKTKSMQKVVVKRYSNDNPFSRTLQMRIRDRLLERIREFEKSSGLADLFLTNIDLYRELTREDPLDKVSRENRVRTSLANFYITNANKWSHL